MPRTDNPLPAFPVAEHRLANGLAVFLLEDHALPLAAVNVNYHVGSMDERPGRTGFAHLFEHMMFQGSKHHDADFFRPLQDIGGTVNGGTDTDRTRYWELVPAAYLERALWLEADRMGFLLEALTPERLANQIAVVQNERRQNYENRPYGLVAERMAAALYPPHHPYSWPTIGHMADIAAASLEDVRDFFRTYYAPNNASLCLVGDFETDRALALVEKYFGAIPPGPPVSRPERWVPRLGGEVRLRIEDRVQLPRAYVAWPTTPVYAADDAALDVFARILGGGRTSRLYQQLVYERQVAQDAVAWHGARQIAGTLTLMLTPRPGHPLEAVEAAALAVLRELLEGGVRPDELARARTDIAAAYVRSIQSIGGFGGLSDRINEFHHYLGLPDMFRWELQRYLDLTPEAVAEAARRHIGAERVVARVEPRPPLAPSVHPDAAGVDRTVMPGPGAESAFRLPPRQRFTLPNGLPVVLAEHHKLPMVSFSLIVRGGLAAEPDDRPGLADLTAALLKEGAGGRTSTKLAEAVEAEGAELSLATWPDATVASLSALRDRLAPSLALLVDVVTRPDFPAAELERLRRQRRVRLTQLRDQPHYLAAVTVQRVLFGGHPYAHPAAGTAASLDAVTLDDVRAFWRAAFVPANAVLVVAGAVTRTELEAALAGFAAWPAGPAPVFDPPPAPPHDGRVLYLVDKPGAAQSVITAALAGPPRATPDYAALTVLNAALGGQFVSRLNLNLREDKGYTYGARSRASFEVFAGTLTATAPVETRVTAPALREILAELEGVAGARPLAEAEIEYATGSLVNGYARRFETPDQIAGELLDVYLHGLPEDDPETLPARLRAVTPADVAAAGARHIRTDRLAVVVVGDAAAVRPELEAFGFGPVVTLDADGRRLAGSGPARKSRRRSRR
jgi:zinc protease